MIAQDLKPGTPETAERFPTEEVAPIIKLNIMIVAGKGIRKKIHLAHLGLTTTLPLAAQATSHVPTGAIVLHPMEDKVLVRTGEIIRAARSIQVAIHQVATHLVVGQEAVQDQEVREEAAVDHVPGVGINSKAFTYENYKRASARWDCYAFCTTNAGAKFY